MDDNYKLPDFLTKPLKSYTPEEEHFWTLWEEYHKKWPEGFDTFSTITTSEDEKELLRSLEYCLDHDMPMEQLHPEWFIWDPEHEKL